MAFKLSAKLIVLVCTLAPALSFGATFPEPSVEYSGDNRIESMGMEVHSKTFYTKDKQRMEIKAEKQGVNMISIIRLDKGVSWNLMVDQKTYTEAEVEESQKNSGDFRSCTVVFSGDSSESVNGVAAKKSHGIVKCPDVEYGGDFWITQESIVVKMDVAGKTDTGQNIQMKTEMSNLKIGPQDQALFEIPAGFAPMGNMNSIMQNASKQMEMQTKMMEQQMKREEEERKKREADDAANRKAEEERIKAEAAQREYSAKKRAEAEKKKKGGLLDDPDVRDVMKSGAKKLFGF